MMRQILRLTRRLDSDSAAAAIAVYSEPSSGSFLPAGDQGYEGVACVDDAARAVVLYARLYDRHRSEFAKEAGLSLMRFISDMVNPDGELCNFILDWSGTHNGTGPTSRYGGEWWTARALYAYAWAGRAFSVPLPAEAWAWIERLNPRRCHLDVGSLAVLAALMLFEQHPAPLFLDYAGNWADMALSATLSSGALPDVRGSQRIHLWGRTQELALVALHRYLRQDELVDAAERSVRAVGLSAVEEAFTGVSVVQPYDISCTVTALDAVADVTGERAYARAATQGRAWFHGRNLLSVQMLDHGRGLVWDGIKGGRRCSTSGAEANIEAALTLFGSCSVGRCHCRTPARTNAVSDNVCAFDDLT